MLYPRHVETLAIALFLKSFYHDLGGRISAVQKLKVRVLVMITIAKTAIRTNHEDSQEPLGMNRHRRGRHSRENGNERKTKENRHNETINPAICRIMLTCMPMIRFRLVNYLMCSICGTLNIYIQVDGQSWVYIAGNNDKVDYSMRE